MKTYFYKIYNKDEEDLTFLVESISISDSKEEDDVLDLKIKTDYLNIELLERKDLKRGSVLYYIFGYVGSKVSETRKARINDVSITYGKSISLSIKAKDFGVFLRKQVSNKIWRNKRVSEIVLLIAKNYGYKSIIEPTRFLYDELPQAGRTDKEFLDDLAAKHGRKYYMRGDTLYFVRETYLGDPQITLTYPENIISLAVSEKESEQKSETTGGESTTVDPETHKEVTKKVVPNNEDKGKTGAESVQFDVNGFEVPQPETGKKKPEKKGVSVNDPAVSDTTNDDTSKAQKQAGEQAARVMTAKIKVEGDPFLRPGEMITLKGVAAQHAGNWYAEKVSHKFSGGFTTEIELTRNASDGGEPETKTANTTDSNESDTVNRKKGPEDSAEPTDGLTYYSTEGGRLKKLDDGDE